MAGTVDVIVRVTIAPRVKGMNWNVSKTRQEAAFAVSASIDPSTPLPPGYVPAWTWSATGMEFDDPNAQSTTARATATGIYYPQCVVHATKPGSGISYDGGEDSAQECAAIGGPIRVSVSGNPEPTYDHDKNDRSKSWYLTYYGHHPATSKPTTAEKTHDATMDIDAQPTIVRNGVVKGTTITWTLPGSTYTADPKTTGFAANGSIASQPLTVHAAATGAFKDGTPKVKFHFDDGVISGDADDDSAETQVSRGVVPNITWVPLVYKVSGHIPRELIRATPATPDEVFPQPQGRTHWTNRARIKYVLKDGYGDLMPGVWVQERFTDNNLNLATNKQSGYVWITVLVSTKDSGTVNAADGTFQGFDFLQYSWALGDTTTYTTVHAYYAGTKDASDNAITGIPLGSSTITFTAGQPGTATQTDPAPQTPPANP